jgi:hypothetical protein
MLRLGLVPLWKGQSVVEALKRVADTDESDYVRVASLKYLRKLVQPSASDDLSG